MGFPFVKGLQLAEGVGNAPTSARAEPVFETGAASLYLPAFRKWSGWRELHSRPPRSEQGRLLLTLHPGKNGTRGRSLTFIPGVRTAVLCDFKLREREWWERKDSHLRPPACRAGALQAELRPRKLCSRLGSHQPPPPSDDGALFTELQERMRNAWSGRPDSRRRSPAPHAGALAAYASSRFHLNGGRDGTRTHFFHRDRVDSSLFEFTPHKTGSRSWSRTNTRRFKGG